MPGYIVTNQNDTIKGLIDDKDWDLSPDTIYFGNDIDSVTNKYSSHDIKAFGVDDKYFYISKNVKIDMSPNRTYELKPMEKGDQILVDTMNKQLFLNVLISGKISLYYYKDFNGKEHFFCQKNKDTTVELVLQRYIMQEQAGLIQHNVDRYKYILSYYMNDCESAKDDIKNLNLNESSLISIVSKYNRCFNSDFNTYIKQQEPSGVKFGIVGGISNTNLSFSGKADLYGLNEAKLNSYTMINAGLFLSIPVSRKFHRHLINFELLLKPINISSAVNANNTTNAVNVNTNTTFNFNLLYLKLNSQYRYVFMRTSNVDYFFNFGFALSYAIIDSNSYSGTSNFYGSISQQGGAIFPVSNFELALIGGLGSKLSKLTFELRAEKGNGMAQFYDFNSTLISYYLLVGYSF
jgi:outer membrane protein with beta-barrel domain